MFCFQTLISLLIVLFPGNNEYFSNVLLPKQSFGIIFD